MADWEGAAGGAESGAGIGATIGSVIPGVGTLIGGAAGGVIGGLAGLFGTSRTDPHNQTFSDPNRGMEDNLINQLSSDKESDTAVNAESRARKSFLDTMENFHNQPGVGKNASVQSALGVKANDALGESLVNIDTQDANQRLRNHEQAASMLSSQRAFDYGNFRDTQAINAQPTFLEKIGQLGVSKLAGAATGSLMDSIAGGGGGGNEETGTGDNSTDKATQTSSPYGPTPSGGNIYQPFSPDENSMYHPDNMWNDYKFMGKDMPVPG